MCALREFLEMHFEQELALATDLCQLAGGHHPELNASLEMIKRNQKHITRNLGKTLSASDFVLPAPSENGTHIANVIGVIENQAPMTLFLRDGVCALS